MSETISDLERRFYEGFANKNLLTANQSEAIGDTRAVDGATLSYVTDKKFSGTTSAKLTAPAAGGSFRYLNDNDGSGGLTYWASVIAGQVYTATARVSAGSTPRRARIELIWFDSNDTYLGLSSDRIGPYTAFNSVGWEQLIFSTQSPIGAAFCRVDIRFETSVAGEVHYVDAVSLMETPNANLVPNSDFENGTETWEANNGTTLSSLAEGYYGTRSMRVTTSATTVLSSAIANIVASSRLIPIVGQTYTMSAWVRSSAATTLNIGPGNIAFGTNYALSANTWTKITHTFTATNTTATWPSIVFNSSLPPVGTTVDVDGVQVVKGSTVVPYLPPKTTNLIANPSFEENANNWVNNSPNTVISSSSEWAFSGSKSLLIEAANEAGAGADSSYFSVTPGSTLTLSLRMKGKVGIGTHTISVGLFKQDNTSVGDSGYLLTSDPITITRTYTVPTDGSVTSLKVICRRATAGVHSYYIDAVQIEHGSVATPYVDGSLGTGYSWDSSENLLSAAASSFEDGTVGGWSNNGATTIANSAAQFYDGTKSLSVTLPATGNGVGTLRSGIGLVAGQVYTASAYVRSSVTLPMQVSTNSAVGSVVNIAANTWTRLSLTFEAVADDILYVVKNGAAASEVFFVDAVQVEQRSFVTPYGQTGVAHASTSTRQEKWVLGQSLLDTALTKLSIHDLEHRYWYLKSSLTPVASYSVADHQRAALLNDLGITNPQYLTNGDLLLQFYQNNSGLTPKEKYTGVDHELAFYKRILGVT